MRLPGSEHHSQECGGAREGNLERGKGENQGSVPLVGAGGAALTSRAGIWVGLWLGAEGKGMSSAWKSLLSTAWLCISEHFSQQV